MEPLNKDTFIVELSKVIFYIECVYEYFRLVLCLLGDLSSFRVKSRLYMCPEAGYQSLLVPCVITCSPVCVQAKEARDQAARRIQTQYRLYKNRTRELNELSRAATFIQQMYRYVIGM